MHWENLRPLLPVVPIFAVLLALLGGWAVMERLHRRRATRHADSDMRRYWIAEKAHQARLRARAWLDRSRTPRLRHRPSLSDFEIAAGLVEDYGPDPVPDKTITTRIARARFRAWHRGTREADFTIGGFFDRHHQDWGDTELEWFEALLEEDDVDILAWALAMRPPPERYAGPLMTALQRLDFVTT